MSFGVTHVRILRCFTKAKEMVNRGSRDEKLGAWEPCRLKLAIIKTLKNSTERRFKGPGTCRMNSFIGWFHGWNMKGAVNCVPAALNQHPRVWKKKKKSASLWSITPSETGEITFSTVYSCIQIIYFAKGGWIIHHGFFCLSYCFIWATSCVILVVFLVELFSYVLVVLFQTVLKSSSLVGGLSALHTQEISMKKAGEVSQYGGAQEPLTELYLQCTCNLWGALWNGWRKGFFMQNCCFDKTWIQKFAVTHGAVRCHVNCSQREALKNK